MFYFSLFSGNINIHTWGMKTVLIFLNVGAITFTLNCLFVCFSFLYLFKSIPFIFLNLVSRVSKLSSRVLFHILLMPYTYNG
ncbi:Uncharacterized protein TCM_008956 [Theobroma cacao]|uniref:Uncharacterized protein n=1 Tax=Theobroma cacao TaxID=3641 RepID=A0A061E4H7_THECC|nr:Uncharacterized protein TCM_008956 [Theobroma cacao]